APGSGAAVRIDQRMVVQALRQRLAARVVQHALDRVQQHVGAQAEGRRQRFLQGTDDQRQGAVAKRQADGDFEDRAAEHGDLPGLEPPSTLPLLCAVTLTLLNKPAAAGTLPAFSIYLRQS